MELTKSKAAAPCITAEESGFSSSGAMLPLASSLWFSVARNSCTAFSTWGLNVWLIFGSTTWEIIRSIPDSSIPDLKPKAIYRKLRIIITISYYPHYLLVHICSTPIHSLGCRKKREWKVGFALQWHLDTLHCKNAVIFPPLSLVETLKWPKQKIKTP